MAEEKARDPTMPERKPVNIPLSKIHDLPGSVFAPPSPKSLEFLFEATQEDYFPRSRNLYERLERFGHFLAVRLQGGVLQLPPGGLPNVIYVCQHIALSKRGAREDFHAVLFFARLHAPHQAFPAIFCAEYGCLLILHHDKGHVARAITGVDFLDAESTAFYEFSARIVRLTLKDGRTQLLITNLDAEQFPLSALRELYARRWGIETSFRELKYMVGLIHLHSRKSDLVLQEILAAFTVFNFTQAVAWSADEGCGHSKYKRRMNFAHAVYLCCEALRGKSAEITGLLERTLTPRRPDRFYPRPKITGNRLSAMYVSAR